MRNHDEFAVNAIIQKTEDIKNNTKDGTSPFFHPETHKLSKSYKQICKHCRRKVKVGEITIYSNQSVMSYSRSLPSGDVSIIGNCPRCGSRISMMDEGRFIKHFNSVRYRKRNKGILIVALLLVVFALVGGYLRFVKPGFIGKDNQDTAYSEDEPKAYTLNSTDDAYEKALPEDEPVNPVEEKDIEAAATTLNETPVTISAGAVLYESGYDYSPLNVLDNDFTTCWAFRGNSGEWLRFDFDEEIEVNSIALCNGYGIDDTRYFNNNRVTSLRIDFDDGTSEEVYIDPDDAINDFHEQQLTIVPLEYDHVVSGFTVRILETIQGERFNDTCISEFYPLYYMQEMIDLPYGGAAPVDDFIFPYSSYTELTDSEINARFANMDTTTARLQSQLAINEIYARYGYNFHPEKGETATMAYNYFNSLGWYQETSKGKSWSNTGAVPISNIESANVNKIVSWQKSVGLR